jgi:uncharacterized membrane protein
MLDDGSFRSLLSVPALDAVALAWFFLLWAGYNLIVDWLLKRPLGLNQHMGLVRDAWMAAMSKRDDRVIDALLIGHLIHSVTFFASTTMLLVAALVGILAAVNQTFEAVMGLSFTIKTTKPMFELKLLLLTGIFVYAFFKFTWSLRQYNYACALVGAMPAALAPARRPALSDPAGRVLTLAVVNFNGGLRAYYFALAVLSWLVHPVLFMIVSAWMLLVLLRRQLRSRTVKAIRAFNQSALDE